MKSRVMSMSNGVIIEGLLFESTLITSDGRGNFTKVLGAGGLEHPFQISEIFWTRSHFGVIRGMHLQKDPHAGAKLIWVSEGTVTDVALDLRVDSETFGHWNSFELSPSTGTIFLPKGVAHGFEVLSNVAIVNYAQECRYVAECDTGIRFDSFGYKWTVSDPVVSERDASLPLWSQWIEELN